MTIRKLLHFLFPRKPHPAIPRRYSGVTSLEWRGNPAAVAMAEQVLKTEQFGQLLAIMEAEAPIHVAPVPYGTATADIVRAYDFQVGYDYALRKLLSLAEPIASHEPEITFPDGQL